MCNKLEVSDLKSLLGGMKIMIMMIIIIIIIIIYSSSFSAWDYLPNNILKKKLRGLSPRTNYTDRAAAVGRRS